MADWLPVLSLVLTHAATLWLMREKDYQSNSKTYRSAVRPIISGNSFGAGIAL